MCTTKLIYKTDSNDLPLDKNIAGKQDFLFPKAEGFEYVEMLHLVYKILIYFIIHGKLKFDTTDSTMHENSVFDSVKIFPFGLRYVTAVFV